MRGFDLYLKCNLIKCRKSLAFDVIRWYDTCNGSPFRTQGGGWKRGAGFGVLAVAVVLGVFVGLIILFLDYRGS